MEELSETYGVDTSSHSSEFLDLLLAMHKGCLRSHVKRLAELGQSRIGDENNIAFLLALYQPGLFPLAVRCGVGVNQGCKPWGTPLCLAVLSRSVELVSELIRSGADVNPKVSDHSPLFLAVRRGDRAMVELLLAGGADVNPKVSDHSPLLLAVRKGDRAMVELLREGGADANRPRPVAKGDLRTTQYLLT